MYAKYAKTLLTLTLVTAGAAAAAAHEPSKADIDARELRQLGQIDEGRQNGSITWREGRKLRSEQKFIATREQQMLADGKLSKAEKRELDRLQDEAAESIKQEKTDGQRRFSWLPRFGR